MSGYPDNWAEMHGACGSNADKEVRCDRCGREYVCTPSSDFYCTPEGDHCCEPCLIGGLRLVVVDQHEPGHGPRIDHADGSR